MENVENVAKAQVYNMLKTDHQKIEVISGECRYNYRCQMNAVHEAINRKDSEIAMCMYIEGNHPIIHFINVDEDGKFIDNTLGNWSSIYDYYLIRKIEKKDFFNVNNIFTEFRRELRSKLPFWVKLLSDIEF